MDSSENNPFSCFVVSLRTWCLLLKSGRIAEREENLFACAPENEDEKKGGTNRAATAAVVA